MRLLSHAYSDHCPIVLDLHGGSGNRTGERPFIFLASWLLHEKFFQLMEREWEWNRDLTCSLKCFTKKLLAWNLDTFENIFKHKRKVQGRLQGVMLALDRRTTVGLLWLKRK